MSLSRIYKSASTAAQEAKALAANVNKQQQQITKDTLKLAADTDSKKAANAALEKATQAQNLAADLKASQIKTAANFIGSAVSQVGGAIASALNQVAANENEKTNDAAKTANGLRETAGKIDSKIQKLEAAKGKLDPNNPADKAKIDKIDKQVNSLKNAKAQVETAFKSLTAKLDSGQSFVGKDGKASDDLQDAKAVLKNADKLVESTNDDGTDKAPSTGGPENKQTTQTTKPVEPTETDEGTGDVSGTSQPEAGPQKTADDLSGKQLKKVETAAENAGLSEGDIKKIQEAAGMTGKDVTGKMDQKTLQALEKMTPAQKESFDKKIAADPALQLKAQGLGATLSDVGLKAGAALKDAGGTAPTTPASTSTSTTQTSTTLTGKAGADLNGDEARGVENVGRTHLSEAEIVEVQKALGMTGKQLTGKLDKATLEKLESPEGQAKLADFAKTNPAIAAKLNNVGATLENLGLKVGSSLKNLGKPVTAEKLSAEQLTGAENAAKDAGLSEDDVKKVQKALGVTETGKLDKETLAKLDTPEGQKALQDFAKTDPDMAGKLQDLGAKLSNLGSKAGTTLQKLGNEGNGQTVKPGDKLGTSALAETQGDDPVMSDGTAMKERAMIDLNDPSNMTWAMRFQAAYSKMYTAPDKISEAITRGVTKALANLAPEGSDLWRRANAIMLQYEKSDVDTARAKLQKEMNKLAEKDPQLAQALQEKLNQVNNFKAALGPEGTKGSDGKPLTEKELVAKAKDLISAADNGEVVDQVQLDAAKGLVDAEKKAEKAADAVGDGADDVRKAFKNVAELTGDLIEANAKLESRITYMEAVKAKTSEKTDSGWENEDFAEDKSKTFLGFHVDSGFGENSIDDAIASAKKSLAAGKAAELNARNYLEEKMQSHSSGITDDDRKDALKSIANADRHAFETLDDMAGDLRDMAKDMDSKKYDGGQRLAVMGILNRFEENAANRGAQAVASAKAYYNLAGHSIWTKADNFEDLAKKVEGAITTYAGGVSDKDKSKALQNFQNAVDGGETMSTDQLVNKAKDLIANVNGGNAIHRDDLEDAEFLIAMADAGEEVDGKALAEAKNLVAKAEGGAEVYDDKQLKAARKLVTAMDGSTGSADTDRAGQSLNQSLEAVKFVAQSGKDKTTGMNAGLLSFQGQVMAPGSQLLNQDAALLNDITNKSRVINNDVQLQEGLETGLEGQQKAANKIRDGIKTDLKEMLEKAEKMTGPGKDALVTAIKNQIERTEKGERVDLTAINVAAQNAAQAQTTAGTKSSVEGTFDKLGKVQTKAFSDGLAQIKTGATANDINAGKTKALDAINELEKQGLISKDQADNMRSGVEDLASAATDLKNPTLTSDQRQGLLDKLGVKAQPGDQAKKDQMLAKAFEQYAGRIQSYMPAKLDTEGAYNKLVTGDAKTAPIGPLTTDQTAKVTNFLKDNLTQNTADAKTSFEQAGKNAQALFEQGIKEIGQDGATLENINSGKEKAITAVEQMEAMGLITADQAKDLKATVRGLVKDVRDPVKVGYDGYDALVGKVQQAFTGTKKNSFEDAVKQVTGKDASPTDAISTFQAAVTGANKVMADTILERFGRGENGQVQASQDLQNRFKQSVAQIGTPGASAATIDESKGKALAIIDQMKAAGFISDDQVSFMKEQVQGLAGDAKALQDPTLPADQREALMKRIDSGTRYAGEALKTFVVDKQFMDMAKQLKSMDVDDAAITMAVAERAGHGGKGAVTEHMLDMIMAKDFAGSGISGGDVVARKKAILAALDGGDLSSNLMAQSMIAQEAVRGLEHGDPSKADSRLRALVDSYKTLQQNQLAASKGITHEQPGFMKRLMSRMMAGGDPDPEGNPQGQELMAWTKAYNTIRDSLDGGAASHDYVADMMGENTKSAEAFAGDYQKALSEIVKQMKPGQKPTGNDSFVTEGFGAGLDGTGQALQDLMKGQLDGEAADLRKAYVDLMTAVKNGDAAKAQQLFGDLQTKFGALRDKAGKLEDELKDPESGLWDSEKVAKRTELAHLKEALTGIQEGLGALSTAMAGNTTFDALKKQVDDAFGGVMTHGMQGTASTTPELQKTIDRVNELATKYKTADPASLAFDTDAAKEFAELQALTQQLGKAVQHGNTDAKLLEALQNGAAVLGNEQAQIAAAAGKSMAEDQLASETLAQIDKVMKFGQGVADKKDLKANFDAVMKDGQKALDQLKALFGDNDPRVMKLQKAFDKLKEAGPEGANGIFGGKIGDFMDELRSMQVAVADRYGTEVRTAGEQSGVTEKKIGFTQATVNLTERVPEFKISDEDLNKLLSAYVQRGQAQDAINAYKTFMLEGVNGGKSGLTQMKEYLDGLQGRIQNGQYDEVARNLMKGLLTADEFAAFNIARENGDDKAIKTYQDLAKHRLDVLAGKSEPGEGDQAFLKGEHLLSREGKLDAADGLRHLLILGQGYNRGSGDWASAEGYVQHVKVLKEQQAVIDNSVAVYKQVSLTPEQAAKLTGDVVQKLEAKGIDANSELGKMVTKMAMQAGSAAEFDNLLKMAETVQSILDKSGLQGGEREATRDFVLASVTAGMAAGQSYTASEINKLIGKTVNAYLERTQQAAVDNGLKDIKNAADIVLKSGAKLTDEQTARLKEIVAGQWDDQIRSALQTGGDAGIADLDKIMMGALDRAAQTANADVARAKAFVRTLLTDPKMQAATKALTNNAERFAAIYKIVMENHHGDIKAAIADLMTRKVREGDQASMMTLLADHYRLAGLGEISAENLAKDPAKVAKALGALADLVMRQIDGVDEAYVEGSPMAKYFKNLAAVKGDLAKLAVLKYGDGVSNGIINVKVGDAFQETLAQGSRDLADFRGTHSGMQSVMSGGNLNFNRSQFIDARNLMVGVKAMMEGRSSLAKTGEEANKQSEVDKQEAEQHREEQVSLAQKSVESSGGKLKAEDVIAVGEMFWSTLGISGNPFASKPTTNTNQIAQEADEQQEQATRDQVEAQQAVQQKLKEIAERLAKEREEARLKSTQDYLYALGREFEAASASLVMARKSLSTAIASGDAGAIARARQALDAAASTYEKTHELVKQAQTLGAQEKTEAGAAMYRDFSDRVSAAEKDGNAIIAEVQGGLLGRIDQAIKNGKAGIAELAKQDGAMPTDAVLKGLKSLTVGAIVKQVLRALDDGGSNKSAYANQLRYKTFHKEEGKLTGDDLAQLWKKGGGAGLNQAQDLVKETKRVADMIQPGANQDGITKQTSALLEKVNNLLAGANGKLDSIDLTDDQRLALQGMRDGIQESLNKHDLSQLSNQLAGLQLILADVVHDNSGQVNSHDLMIMHATDLNEGTRTARKDLSDADVAKVGINAVGAAERALNGVDADKARRLAELDVAAKSASEAPGADKAKIQSDLAAAKAQVLSTADAEKAKILGDLQKQLAPYLDQVGQKALMDQVVKNGPSDPQLKANLQTVKNAFSQLGVKAGLKPETTVTEPAGPTTVSSGTADGNVVTDTHGRGPASTVTTGETSGKPISEEEFVKLLPAMLTTPETIVGNSDEMRGVQDNMTHALNARQDYENKVSTFAQAAQQYGTAQENFLQVANAVRILQKQQSGRSALTEGEKAADNMVLHSQAFQQFLKDNGLQGLDLTQPSSLETLRKKLGETATKVAKLGTEMTTAETGMKEAFKTFNQADTALADSVDALRQKIGSGSLGDVGGKSGAFVAALDQYAKVLDSYKSYLQFKTDAQDSDAGIFYDLNQQADRVAQWGKALNDGMTQDAKEIKSVIGGSRSDAIQEQIDTLKESLPALKTAVDQATVALNVAQQSLVKAQENATGGEKGSEAAVQAIKTFQADHDLSALQQKLSLLSNDNKAYLEGRSGDFTEFNKYAERRKLGAFTPDEQKRFDAFMKGFADKVSTMNGNNRESVKVAEGAIRTRSDALGRAGEALRSAQNQVAGLQSQWTQAFRAESTPGHAGVDQGALKDAINPVINGTSLRSAIATLDDENTRRKVTEGKGRTAVQAIDGEIKRTKDFQDKAKGMTPEQLKGLQEDWKKQTVAAQQTQVRENKEGDVDSLESAYLDARSAYLDAKNSGMTGDKLKELEKAMDKAYDKWQDEAGNGGVRMWLSQAFGGEQGKWALMAIKAGIEMFMEGMKEQKRAQMLRQLLLKTRAEQARVQADLQMYSFHGAAEVAHKGK